MREELFLKIPTTEETYKVFLTGCAGSISKIKDGPICKMPHKCLAVLVVLRAFVLSGSFCYSLGTVHKYLLGGPDAKSVPCKGGLEKKSPNFLLIIELMLFDGVDLYFSWQNGKKKFMKKIFCISPPPTSVFEWSRMFSRIENLLVFIVKQYSIKFCILLSLDKYCSYDFNVTPVNRYHVWTYSI